MVRQLVLGRKSLSRIAGEGELEREGRVRGAVTWEIVGQVVLQYVGVEGLPSHQPVVQGIGLHDVHGEGEHVVLEAVEAEQLQAGSQAGGQEGGQSTG